MAGDIANDFDSQSAPAIADFRRVFAAAVNAVVVDAVRRAFAEQPELAQTGAVASQIVELLRRSLAPSNAEDGSSSRSVPGGPTAVPPAVLRHVELGLIPLMVQRFGTDGSRLAGALGAMRAFFDEVASIGVEKRLLAERTERRRLEEALERERYIQGANRLKSEFLANMGHELRAPLNAIIGFADLMWKGKVGPVADNHREYLEEILASSRQLLALINGVLELAKIESGKMEFRPVPVDLSEVVTEIRAILGALASTKRIHVEASIDPEVSRVVLDPAKLKQVLYNYLSNALKFTGEDGRISISARSEPPSRVRIEVEDTGVGIRQEDLSWIFREFQRVDPGNTSEAGAGLGLSLTKRIVEAQGGEVGARSTFGVGSVFWALLPRGAVPAEASAGQVSDVG